MEDIKKAIEEEARYSLMKKAGVDMNEFKNHHELVLTKNDVLRVANDCANFILSKWEESERWRKVEEELEVGSNIIMRQKTEYGMHYSLFTNITQQIIDIVTKEYDEWKPIH